MKRILILTIAIAIGLAMGKSAEAVDYNDAANGDWGTSTTWSPAGVPGASDTVTIDSNTVTLSANQASASITITAGNLTDNGQTLTVNGNISIANTSGIFISTGTLVQAANG